MNSLVHKIERPHLRPRPPQILLGITGSVASIKGPELALSIAQSLRARVIVVLTSGGTNFWYKAKEYNPEKWMEYRRFMGCHGTTRGINSGDSGDSGNNSGDSGDGESFETNVFSMLETQAMEGAGADDGKADGNDAHDFSGEIGICRAEDEWGGWNKIGDPVLHIQLRDWADMIIVAPLSAHTLAKISNGLCDDTLSCILRAWDYGHLGPSSSSCNNDHDAAGKQKKRKPIIIAPAMNTAMWVHPLTKQQLETMKGFWNDQGISNRSQSNNCDEASCRTYIVDPQVKTLACGDVGAGAMASVDDIVNTAKKYLDC